MFVKRIYCPILGTFRSYVYFSGINKGLWLGAAHFQSQNRCVHHLTTALTCKNGAVDHTFHCVNFSRPSSFSLSLPNRDFLIQRKMSTNFGGSDPNEPVEFCRPKMAERLRLRDGMPKSYTLIYRSDFGMYLLSAQIVILLVGCMGLFVAQLRMITEPKTEEELEKGKMSLREVVEQSKDAPLFKAMKENAPTGEQVLTVKADLNPSVTDDIGVVEQVFLLISLVFFLLSTFKLLRLVPVRIYMNKKDHCVAVLYGHIIPGKLTHHEFVAGTVRAVKEGSGLHAGSLYKDGSGRYLMLMERFFRTPADFNKLLGYQDEFLKEFVRKQKFKHKN